MQDDLSFFVEHHAHLIATPMTRGPWDNRFQHGGPPSALLAGAIEREVGGQFSIARFGVAFRRPVPIDRFRIRVEVTHAGRQVQRVSAALLHGDDAVLEARALCIRRADVPVPPVEGPEPWPDADALPPFTFTFFQHETAYHRGIDLRLAQGTSGTTPVRFWARPRIPLVAGRETSPLERLVLLADAQSGMGPPLDPTRYTFVNPDLTVYLERPTFGAWLGFDIRSTANSSGFGLAQSQVVDAQGYVARTAQSLVVAPRPA